MAQNSKIFPLSLFEPTFSLLKTHFVFNPILYYVSLRGVVVENNVLCSLDRRSLSLSLSYSDLEVGSVCWPGSSLVTSVNFTQVIHQRKCLEFGYCRVLPPFLSHQNCK